MNEMRKENKMGTMSVGKLLVSMSWPAMISMIINALYNIIDSIFVARIGENALAAVTLIFPIQFLMIAIGVGTAIGINSLISRRLGAKLYDKANMAATGGFMLAFANWLFFAVLGLFFSEKFLKIFSSTEEIIKAGSNYMKIVTLCSLFLMVTITIEKIIQGTGNMVRPMFASVIGATVNIILDPILIFGYFGMPKMGVTGAAIATIIGQAVSASINLISIFKKNNDLKISFFSKEAFDIETIKEIYAVGLPSIVMQAIGSALQFGINLILSSYSGTAIAVFGVYMRLQSFVFMPTFGINQGAMPVFGYNYGAGDKDRLMKAYKIAFLMALGIMTAGLIVFEMFPERLLSIFSATGEMYRIGVRALRILSLCFVPASFGIISAGLFAATGHGMLSLFSSIIRQMVGILPLAYFLGKMGGLEMIWLSFPLAEILGTAYVIIAMRWLYNKKIKTLDKLEDNFFE